MVFMERSFSSPSSARPSTVIDVSRPPTPSSECTLKHDTPSRRHRSTLRSIENMDSASSLQGRHLDTNTRRPSAPSPSVPTTLTSLRIHAKTSAATAETVPITATATTTTTTTTATATAKATAAATTTTTTTAAAAAAATAAATATSTTTIKPLVTAIPDSVTLPAIAAAATMDTATAAAPVAVLAGNAESNSHSFSSPSSRTPVPEQPPEPTPNSPHEAVVPLEPQQKMASNFDGASSPANPADITPVTYSFSPKPLIQNASFYVNSRLEPEPEGTSLDELAHLVRLSKYQERKRANTRLRLQLTLISTALSVRLVRCGEMAQQNLAECFQADDRSSFASLYNAVHNVRKSCAELRKYALLEPEMDSFRSPVFIESPVPDSFGAGGHSRDGPTSISHFLDDISVEARDTFLGFLTAIRNNPDYLATRLCSLKTSELVTLAAFSQGMEPVDSVLPFHNRPSSFRNGVSGKSSTHRHTASTNGRDPDFVQKLLSFQRHDPLSALIHTCFANSAGPDSAEDKRRTDIWASACARLISEKGAAGEPVLIAVINAWSAMRGWAGRSNMEWFLMKILEDGAFLLDRAEDQNGTRFNLYEWTSKDHIAAEEFYDRAINDLFDVIDDEDATGIPEGLIELGNQILGKLDVQLADSTRNWLVCKWLFGIWLLGVIIHPEMYGLMTEYHITEYGRQKILKEVALRAQSLVVERTMSMGHPKNAKPVSTPPAIKTHIEAILAKFCGPNARPLPRLLPARSITSLQETAEVHPYLVLSPADLVTLVNALFPERRPRSAQSSSNRSGPGSVSGFSVISQPVPANTPRANADNYSFLSASVSSTASDATTSAEPLLEDQRTGTSFRFSPPSPSISGQDQQRPTNNYEDDAYRLHLAVNDMTHSLGQDIVAGSCHPCAERWAVVFISADGNRLSLQMMFDADNDAEEDEVSSSIETDDDTDDQGSDLEKFELDKNYHQLRDSILKLVQDYEIPPGLDTDGNQGSTFSNRASHRKTYRMKSKDVVSAKDTMQMQSRNPYRRQPDMRATSGNQTPFRENVKGKTPQTDLEYRAETGHSVLISMLSAASSQSRAQSDFLSAHLYWRTIQQLDSLTAESLRHNGFAALLGIFSRGPRDSIRRSAAAVEEYDAWLIWLKQSQERAEGLTETMMRRLRALRDKMWYVTDVRNSGPYEFSRNIAVALKTMGTSRKWDAYRRARQSLPRGPNSSYLYRAESEIVELLAAVEDQGGPNKLSDDQAEKTIQWLEHLGIENFCRGEERIHRFCCEIGSCVDKLIGENLMTAPVLWASDLYARDRQYLERNSSGRQDRDRGSVIWDDASSIRSFGDSDSRRNNMSSRPNSAVRGDLRTRPGQNNPALQSFDSGRHSTSRASTSLSDILDTEGYFSGRVMSPVSTIDSEMTYWSPFQASTSPSTATSRTQSPTASVASLPISFSQLNKQMHHTDQGSLRSHASLHSAGRPGSSVSSADTVLQRCISNEKSKFLTELRQTLTSLLLSDLGNLVFSRGSETDAWLETLGQECIDRNESALKKQHEDAVTEQKIKSIRSSPKQSAGEKTTTILGSNVRFEDGGRSADGSNGSQPTEDGSSTITTENPVTPASRVKLASRLDNNPAAATKKGTKDFPFAKAYSRLLRMFCVHPNPYAKLAALLELENLIVASLSSRSTRRRLALLTRSGLGPMTSRSSSAAGSSEEPAVPTPTNRAKPLEETIDNVKGRRSSTFAALSFLASPASPRRGPYGPFSESRSSYSIGSSANKDAILAILLSLFHEASIRPKTLFRDLQFIASFVPPEDLDRTESGKAFWNAGLAALLLKKEVCSTMVEMADEIVGIYMKTRKGPSTGAGAYPDNTTDSPSTSTHTPSLSTYSLADAARMWTITAKEGDPTSQRELAIFYLSNPELVERTTLPLSKPREVFKKAVMEKYGGSSGGGRYHQHQASGTMARGHAAPGSSHNSSGSSGTGGIAGGVSDVRNDPALMCVAIHWMEAAEQGGDELARAFLKQSNEMR